ncbi:PREDICTED: transcription factor TGA2-like isoform X3 [Populus euphratica]|uniref:Transcription factor TGA2-like isoform X3 n=1 Tax=Populus euphratica TaxID=75702 RepID=A0AAJ6TZN1_POPEU|nr:PREDICTED: transcription factor TGA2-like isoform X3 [Populus euphratica]
MFQLDFDSGRAESLELYILGYNFDLYKLFIIRGVMSLVRQVLASGGLRRLKWRRFMGRRTDAEDEKKAVGMPSFDPQLPISNAIVERSTVHPYRVNDFGVFLEDSAIDLSAGTVFNSAKESTQAIPSDRLHSGTFEKYDRGQSTALVASDSSDRTRDKMDQKTLRRLAQNREAARKSRLRKKAYVQQLESSRLKLTQLEQELQRARQQGIFISSSGDQTHSMSGNGAMAFDVEYARWLEEQNRQINELRSAVNSHAGDAELRIIIDGIMAHYDEVFKLKSNAAKADVFHLLSGMWKTPAERCFLWLGGFRSSELLKLLMNQLEPLTEQQLVGIGNLQQSSQQAEDALSQGMEALQQSLSETLSSGSLGSSGSSGNVANYMGQMAMAMGKLGTLEGFIRQADNLRQQTLQQMHRILTTRQSARALLAIHDYFSRLRALSSLWLARPKE